MYNRYIPQPDGTFLRSKVMEQEPVPQAIPSPEIHTEPEAVPTPVQTHPERKPQTRRYTQPRQQPPQHHSAPRESPGNIGSFLKQLLPQNFDTEDLIVVLLLLLMSGNAANDQNSALLTLAIYLFL